MVDGKKVFLKEVVLNIHYGDIISSPSVINNITSGRNFELIVWRFANYNFVKITKFPIPKTMLKGFKG